MRWRKIPIRASILLYLVHCCSASNSVTVSVRVSGVPAGSPPFAGGCSVAEQSSYVDGMASWSGSSVSSIVISNCARSYATTTTTSSPSTTSTITGPPTTSTETSTTTDSSYTTQTTTSTTVVPVTNTTMTTSPTTSTTTTPPSTLSTSDTTRSSIGPITTTTSTTTSEARTATTTTTTSSTQTTSTASQTPTTMSSTTTSTTETTSTESQTTATTSPTASPTSSTSTTTETRPTSCPSIPPPLSPWGYTESERNAYCAEAEGTGSYCKCEQVRAGRVCKAVAFGFGLNCSCDDMCASQGLRRLARDGTDDGLIDISFGFTSDFDMDSLLARLKASPDLFLAAAGLPSSASVAMTSFQFTPGKEPVDPSVGGSVSALIEFSRESVARSLRRLSQTESLADAVTSSVTELMGSELPTGARVSCVVVEFSSKISANVTIDVDSDIGKTESLFSAFLATDLTGQSQLPQLVSAKSALPLTYSPGYVPAVYVNPSGSTLVEVLNILPYVAIGAALVVVAVAFVVYRYRFVIRSWWDNQKLGFGGYASGWTGGRFAAQFEGDKSETSSTPDTATNVDDNEFDDYILRTMDNAPVG